MTICPIALAVRCVGCPFVRICLARRLLGDYGSYQPPPPAEMPEIRVKCPHGPTRPKPEGSSSTTSKTARQKRSGRKSQHPRSKRQRSHPSNLELN
jgi:hypothetical protein